MEIKIEKPTKAINSLIFNQETGFSLYKLDGDYYLSGDATEKELLDAFAAHNPPAPSEPTVAEKLASVGLSVEDLKSALGLS
jgi:hypothetical protein